MKDFFADSLSHLLHHIQLDPSQSHLDPANHPSSLINRKKTALYDDLAVYDQYPSATIWLITDVTINRSDSHIQDLRHALHTYLPLLWGKSYQVYLIYPGQLRGIAITGHDAIDRLITSLIYYRSCCTSYQSLWSDLLPLLNELPPSTVLILSDMLDVDKQTYHRLGMYHRMFTMWISLHPYAFGSWMREYQAP